MNKTAHPFFCPEKLFPLAVPLGNAHAAKSIKQQVGSNGGNCSYE